jgi:predicted peptidase
LILYLHGWGEHGYDLEVLKKHPLPETLRQQADFPFIVASPQMLPELDSWSDMIDSLNILLDEIQATYSVDSRRVYLTGISMGGAGTWQFGLKYPQRFAALVPVAGYYLHDSYTVPDNICDLKDVPVWAFHGDSDTAVLPFGAEVLVDAFKSCGGNIQFTLYPNSDHEETWRQAYADPELYAWLLLQTRK